MEKYVVERDKVCAGILCRITSDGCEKTNDRLISPYRYMNLGNTNAHMGYACRSILFLLMKMACPKI